MKKLFAIILSIILATVMLAACAGDTPAPDEPEGEAQQQEAAPEDPPADSGDAATGDRPVFQISTWASGYAETYQRAEDAHNAAFDDIELRIEMVAGDYGAWLTTSLMSDTLPEAFFIAPYVTIRDFAEQGAVMDITDMAWTDVFFDDARDSVTHNGRLFGVPFAQQIINIFYNVDIFDELGLDAPETVSELRHVLETLYAAGYQPLSIGYRDTWVVWQVMTGLLATAMGSADEMHDFIERMNAGEASFGDLPNIEGVMEVMQMLGDYSGVRFMDTDYAQMVADFAVGDAAMFVNGDWAVGDVLQINPDARVGMIPYAVSDNPNETLLSSDIVIAIANNANADRGHVETIWERIVDPHSTTSWTYYVVTEGAFLMGFPFYAAEPHLSVAGEQYIEWLQAGRVIPWLQNFVPMGFGSEIDGIEAQFMLRNMDEDTFIQTLDDAWRRVVAD